MSRTYGRFANWYFLVGLTLSVAGGIWPDVVGGPSYLFATMQILPVMILAAKINKISRGLVLSVSLIGAWYAATEIVAGLFGDTGIPRLITNIMDMIGSFLIVFVMVMLVRRRRNLNASAVLGDALIVGLGSWLISWVAFLQPTLAISTEPLISSLIEGLYQPTGSVILFLMAVYLFTETSRNPSSFYVGAAVLSVLLGDLMYSLVGAGHVGDGILAHTDTFYTLGYFSIAAAFLHPSIAALDSTEGSGDSQRLLGRLIITTSSLIFPVIVLASSGPKDAADQIVRSISALVLAGAVTLRVVHSVRANSDAQLELLRQAQTDALTGLPNRSLLLDRISAYVHESWRPDREPTLYFVDLDRFKNINDSLGHSAGDEVLRIVAHRLKGAVPQEAMVARLSGDEYVVLDPTTRSLGSASALAERLLSVFREPIALPQGDVFVTASIGVSSIDSMAAKPEDVLRHADTAMYRAKDSGRNCMAFYDESMHERIAHRLSVETALYRALDRRELRLFHQPILDLDTGEVVGFEALMRWQQGDGTIVSPAEFIPIAEETGTIIPIGAWALLEALTQLRRWIDDGVCSPTATMSVNVSPRQLADPNLPSVVAEALARSGVDASLLWIELTESVMISEPELALATLQKMKALGVRVALDDFGTGYSSLSLLQRFPLQRIKIDRAFVQGVADNPSDRALVRTIVAMGTSLGLDLVAEGVESLHQMQVLHELGCKKAQGYLISHPVPADAMRSTVSALERIGRFPLLRGEHRAGQL
ncbi:MAG: EAL domain-containing protein [Actinobacteria bacterium]|nr:EAL domain-containing protein [Actinomycetota bacterium]